MELEREWRRARRHSRYGALTGALAAGSAAALGAVGALALTTKDFRARNAVERVVLVLLGAAATVAILTTLGIVLSMLFETRSFFS